MRRLEGPVLPSVLAHLWDWFNELSRSRGSGMGPASLTYQDIEAWKRAMHRRPSPWEVEVIMEIDALWMSIMPDPDASGPPLLDDEGALDRDALRDRLERAFNMFR